jgi:hypothetical protein
LKLRSNWASHSQFAGPFIEEISMAKSWKLLTASLGVFLAVAASASNAAPDPKSDTQTAHPLVGTWKMVSTKYDGEVSKLPDDMTMLKHVTPTQFMWVIYDKSGKVVRAAGGSHAMKGENYDETPEYGLGAERIKGKTHKFTWRVDGNKWRHDGSLPGVVKIEEIWERVETKSDTKSNHPLVGTWRIVSAKYQDKDVKFPEGTTALKHVTPTQFMWVRCDKDGNVLYGAGGGYTIKGDGYEETTAYGFGEFEAIKGKTHKFQWRVEGNKWLHNGSLADGFKIEEVWERVEKKDR